MSEAKDKTQSQRGWLDTWIIAVAKSDDMQLRANAAVALASLGGPGRLDQFVTLVGDMALAMKDGKKGSAEAVAIALNETKRDSFDRAGLDDSLRRLRSSDAPEHEAARALLAPTHPLKAWWRLRRIAPRAGWLRTAGVALQHASAATAVVLAVMWAVIDQTPTFDIVTKGFAGLVALFVPALVLAILVARVSVPGQRGRIGLLIDSLFCGLVAALPFIAILVFGSTADEDKAGVAFDWILVGVTIVLVASVRLLVGVTPSRRRQIEPTLSAVSLPILAVTILALGTTAWLGGRQAPADASTADWLKTISWMWFGFVVFAPAFAAGVRATDELRRTTITLFRGFRPAHPALLLLSVALIAGTRLIVERQPPRVIDATRIPGPFTVVNDEPFALKLPGSGNDKFDLSIARDSSDVDVMLEAKGRYVDQVDSKNAKPRPYDAAATLAPLDASADATREKPLASDVDDDGLAKPIVSRLGQHFQFEGKKARRLCLVRVGHRRCGVHTVDVEGWFGILTGHIETLSPPSELHVFALPSKPAATTPVVIDTAALERLKRNKEDVVLKMRPPPEAPVLEIRSPTPMYLTVTPGPRDVVRDRLTLVQLNDDGPFQVWAADDPDPPTLHMRIEPGRSYRVCVRMMNAAFLDCVHRTRGLLAEEVTLTFSNTPPSKIFESEAGEAATEETWMADLQPPKTRNDKTTGDAP